MMSNRYWQRFGFGLTGLRVFKREPNPFLNGLRLYGLPLTDPVGFQPYQTKLKLVKEAKIDKNRTEPRNVWSPVKKCVHLHCKFMHNYLIEICYCNLHLSLRDSSIMLSVWLKITIYLPFVVFPLRNLLIISVNFDKWWTKCNARLRKKDKIIYRLIAYREKGKRHCKRL